MGFGGQKNWGRQEIFLVSGAVSRANNSRCVEICVIQKLLKLASLRQ